MPKANIPLSYPRGVVLLRSRYNENQIEELKQLPGCRYAPDVEAGAWLIPEELMMVVGAICRKWRTNGTFTKPWGELQARALPWAEAEVEGFRPLPHQIDGVARALKFGSQLFNYPTGTGKTKAALGALAAIGAQNVLIVCPAIVRGGWQQQAKSFGRDVLMIESSADLALIDPALPRNVAISYELLARAPALMELKWDALIVDEIHMAKNARVARSKAVYELSAALPPTALRLGLTATPVALEPKDLQHQLAILWPGVNGKQGRWGTWFQFASRYVNVDEVVVDGKHLGRSFSGLNEDNIAELQERLASAVHTVPFEAVAPYLPPFHVETLRFKPKDKAIREATERWKAAKNDKSAEAAIKVALHQNVGIAANLALNSIETCAHVAIVCYYHETADCLMSLLQAPTAAEKVPVYRIPSDGSPAERLERIEVAKRAPRSIAVMTMKSIGIGIDSLTSFTHAIFAELYYSPEIMIQALGRFSRLSSTSPSLATMICLEGTISEFIASAVIKRAKAANKLFDSKGGSMDKLEKSLAKQESDSDFMRGLLDAAMSGGNDD